MSKKSLVVVIALVAAITLSVTGQEEPLPVVQAKITPLGAITPEPTIYLAVEPISFYQQPTLAEAARRNDFVSFDALYRAAKQRGEPVGAFDALYELWSWSMNDPIGAFYGQETYQRLANAHPGFARYIEPFRIIDDRGNAFYPTSETRAFLLDRAVEGRPTPRVQVAEQRSTTSARTQTTTPRRTAAVPAAGAATSRRRSETRVAQSTPKPATAETAVATQKPVAPVTEPAITEAPVIVKAEDPAPAPAPVATAPAPAPAVPAEPQQIADNTFGNRGILLLVIGLIGVGLLAVILRTPKETMPATILTPTPPNAADPPPPPVEFRKTPLPGSVKSEEPPKPRATGSRG